MLSHCFKVLMYYIFQRTTKLLAALSTHSDYYSLAVKYIICLAFQRFRLFRPVCLKRLRVYPINSLGINYVCITFLSICASDVNISFENVFDSPYDCRRYLSMPVLKVYIKVTYGDVSEMIYKLIRTCL